MGFKQSYFFKKNILILAIFMLIFTPALSISSSEVYAEKGIPTEQDVTISDGGDEHDLVESVKDEVDDAEEANSSEGTKDEEDSEELEATEEEEVEDAGSDEGVNDEEVDSIEAQEADSDKGTKDEDDSEDSLELKTAVVEPVDETPVEERIITVDRDGCIVYITTELGTGDYTLIVRDDGIVIDEIQHTMTEPGEHLFEWQITQPAMDGAPGVRLMIVDENDQVLDFRDPYQYPAEVADQCAQPKPEQEVTPTQPEVTQATCDVNGNIVDPIITLPENDGVMYVIDGDVKAGETITIIAAPMDENTELVIPSDWTQQEEYIATLDITLDEVNCEADTPIVDRIITVDRDGCIVSITTELGIGDYTLEVWDDGMLIEEIPHTMTESGEHIFIWEIKQAAMESAPGVAFVIKDENNAIKDTLDPYQYPREVAQMCGGVEEDKVVGITKKSTEKPTPEPKVKPTVVEGKDKVVEGTLPMTATSMFNILLAGSVLFIFGGISLFIFRKRSI